MHSGSLRPLAHLNIVLLVKHSVRVIRTKLLLRQVGLVIELVFVHFNRLARDADLLIFTHLFML